MHFRRLASTGRRLGYAGRSEAASRRVERIPKRRGHARFGVAFAWGPAPTVDAARRHRVTKIVTMACHHPLSCRVTQGCRVRANPPIFLTMHHSASRWSQLPKLDVAGSIPVARSTLKGVTGTPVAPFVRAVTGL